MADIFSIKCSQCGSPLEFNIISQNYHCPACGSNTPAEEISMRARMQYKEFDNEQSLKLTKARNAQSVYSCGSCGASIMIPENELAGKCDFCGTSITKKEFTGTSFPQGIIPFFITKDEAIELFMKWAEGNMGLPAIHEALETINEKLIGYYLPFQLIKGPIRLDFKHRFDTYTCGGYLEGIFVSQTERLENMVLDCAEPFDTSDMVPFDFSYTAGQRTLLPDLTEDQVIDRAVEETGRVYDPFVANVFEGWKHSYKISSTYENETDLLLNTVYLPMYVMKIDQGKQLLVINGQTGRVAYGEKNKTAKSEFGFMKRDNNGTVEKEYREFPKYQPKRPLFYKIVTEEIGYNIGKHTIRRVITGYRTELRAGIYKRNIKGEFVFSTRFAKYANGGAGNDDEIYFGENFAKETKQKTTRTLLLSLVLGVVLFSVGAFIFNATRKVLNGDFGIEETIDKQSNSIPDGYYIGFIAKPDRIQTRRDGKATEANIRFTHLDGKTATAKYTCDEPRFMPEWFLAIRNLNTPDSEWIALPKIDYYFNKSIPKSGWVIVRPIGGGEFLVIPKDDPKVKDLLDKYKNYWEITEEHDYSVPLNYYEPE